MTLARLLHLPTNQGPWIDDWIVESATVAGNVRSVADASAGHSPTLDTAAGSSIATIAGPAAGSLRCNNASLDALAETRARILLANTSGFVAAGRSPCSFSGSLAFFEDLKDLDQGSWERPLPEGSSLGGDATPLRGAFQFLCRDSPGIFPNSIKASLILMTGFYLPKLMPSRNRFAWPGSAAILQWHPGSRWSAKMAYFFGATDKSIPGLRSTDRSPDFTKRVSLFQNGCPKSEIGSPFFKTGLPFSRMEARFQKRTLVF